MILNNAWFQLFVLCTKAKSLTAIPYDMMIIMMMMMTMMMIDGDDNHNNDDVKNLSLPKALLLGLVPPHPRGITR